MFIIFFCSSFIATLICSILIGKAKKSAKRSFFVVVEMRISNWKETMVKVPHGMKELTQSFEVYRCFWWKMYKIHTDMCMWLTAERPETFSNSFCDMIMLKESHPIWYQESHATHTHSAWRDYSKWGEKRRQQTWYCNGFHSVCCARAVNISFIVKWLQRHQIAGQGIDCFAYKNVDLNALWSILIKIFKGTSQ